MWERISGQVWCNYHNQTHVPTDDPQRACDKEDWFYVAVGEPYEL